MTHLNQFLATLLLSTTLLPTFTTSQPPKIIELDELKIGSVITSDSFDDIYMEIIREALVKVEELERTELFSVKEATLYDVYSNEELELLFRVVEAEVADGDIESKSHVASVIFNRLKEGWWGGDLTRSLMTKNQFEVITNGRYKRVEITEDTILACEIAFQYDTAQGALFFDSTDGKSWAAKKCLGENPTMKWLFQDHVGHDFYAPIE